MIRSVSPGRMSRDSPTPYNLRATNTSLLDTRLSLLGERTLYLTGNTVHVGIHPSKVVITKIKMDKDRKALLDRKDRSKKGGKAGAATGVADSDVNMAGVD